jgi:hypothetical protein
MVIKIILTNDYKYIKIGDSDIIIRPITPKKLLPSTSKLTRGPSAIRQTLKAFSKASSLTSIHCPPLQIDLGFDVAGGHHFMNAPINDALIAYALPD